MTQAYQQLPGAKLTRGGADQRVPKPEMVCAYFRFLLATSILDLVSDDGATDSLQPITLAAVLPIHTCQWGMLAMSA